MPDMADLFAQAQKMQEQLMNAQAQAAEQSVEGQSGGGAVRVGATGALEFTSVSISPEAVAAGDIEMLQDLVLAAIKDAKRKVDELNAQALGGLGGLGGMLG